MVKTLDELKDDAIDATTFRGHTMGVWIDYFSHSTNECVNCGKYVQVNTKPLPNEIDIGGDAVALGCDDAD